MRGGSAWRHKCHARESGHPDLAAHAAALDSRLRGNDSVKDLILNDAADQSGASLKMSPFPSPRKEAGRGEYPIILIDSGD